MVFRYFSINWDIAVVECDWKDAILEQKAHFLISCVFSGARDAAPRFVLVFTVNSVPNCMQICEINRHSNLPLLISCTTPTSNDAYPHA